jgi:hypothetical protein
MALIVAPPLCLFTIASNIFMLKKDTTKTHHNNIGFNVPDNAPLVIYQASLVGHWLIMGLETDSLLVNARLSKMGAAIENIAFLMVASNLAINQLMERGATMAITTKATSMEEPKWTTMMVKNVHQVVNRAVETLADATK